MMSIDSRPSFIPAAVAESPIDFTWKGDLAHIGPVDAVMPLMIRLGNVTNCGQITLMAGLLYWAGWRLKNHAPVPAKRFLQMAPAIFAYQVDRLYFDRGPVPVYEEYEDEFTPALSAAFEIERFARRALKEEEFWNAYYPPVRETFHTAYLVSHIMPKKSKRGFAKWRDDLAARVKAVAPKPDEPFRMKKEFPTPEAHLAWVAPHQGTALPPQILDPNFNYDESQRTVLLDKYLSELDWRENPYLRSPEAMKAAGFAGAPYRLK